MGQAAAEKVRAMRLKADLHLHTREVDGFISYDARTLIDRAASEGYQVLSITNHNAATWSEALREYAEERGILLIPGMEATIEKTHVLLYGASAPPARFKTFADLRRHRESVELVVAAHPFFPDRTCLRKRLVREIDLFDGLEFSHFYTRWIDFNRRAVRLAREVGLPLIGNSDGHLSRQFGTTYSLIEAEPSVDSVLRAIRKGNVEVVSRPLALHECAGIGAELIARAGLEKAKRQLRLIAGPVHRPADLMREPEG